MATAVKTAVKAAVNSTVTKVTAAVEPLTTKPVTTTTTQPKMDYALKALAKPTTHTKQQESAAAVNSRQQYGNMPGMGMNNMGGMGMNNMGGMNGMNNMVNMPYYGNMGGMYVDPCATLCGRTSGTGGACFNGKGTNECCCRSTGEIRLRLQEYCFGFRAAAAGLHGARFATSRLPQPPELNFFCCWLQGGQNLSNWLPRAGFIDDCVPCGL
jgi:hypothetical protein